MSISWRSIKKKTIIHRAIAKIPYQIVFGCLPRKEITSVLQVNESSQDTDTPNTEQAVDQQMQTRKVLEEILRLKLEPIESSLNFKDDEHRKLLERVVKLERAVKALELENNALKAQLNTTISKVKTNEVLRDEQEQYMHQDCVEIKGRNSNQPAFLMLRYAKMTSRSAIGFLPFVLGLMIMVLCIPHFRVL